MKRTKLSLEDYDEYMEQYRLFVERNNGSIISFDKKFIEYNKKLREKYNNFEGGWYVDEIEALSKNNLEISDD